MERAQQTGEPFPLVVIDCNMPGMDGLELAEQIGRKPGLAGVFVMMFTSGDHLGDVARCHELGVAASVFKPILPSSPRCHPTAWAS
jgi:CheY-like chemotaxis protein